MRSRLTEVSLWARYRRQRLRTPRRVRLPRRIHPSPGMQVRMWLAGASFHRDAIQRLAARSGVRRRVPIMLSLEPDNPHDPSAVAVLSAAGRVGYLPAAVSREWAECVANEAAAGRTVLGEVIFESASDDVFDTLVTLPRWWWLAESRRRYPRRCDIPARTLSPRRRRALDRARAWKSPYPQAETPLEHLVHFYLAQIPPPFVVYSQVPLRPWRLDFFIPHALLACEIDGPHHRSARQRMRDQERDEELAGYGIRVLRFTNDTASADPGRLARTVLTECCRRTRTPGPTNPASPFYGWRALPPPV